MKGCVFSGGEYCNHICHNAISIRATQNRPVLQQNGMVLKALLTASGSNYSISASLLSVVLYHIFSYITDPNYLFISCNSYSHSRIHNKLYEMVKKNKQNRTWNIIVPKRQLLFIYYICTNTAAQIYIFLFGFPFHYYYVLKS